MPTVSLAVLFAILSESPAVRENLGDLSAQTVRGRCLSIIGNIIGQYEGKVVKISSGPEILTTFASLRLATLAASEIQLTMQEANECGNIPVGDFGMRIGIHAGLVIEDKDNVFGETVNTARYLAELAKPGQILTSLQTVRELPPELRVNARLIEKTLLSRDAGRLVLRELLWQGDDQAMANAGRGGGQKRVYSRMKIRCNYQSMLMNNINRVLAMGRDPRNDIVISDFRVSRQHARIDYQRGQFILTDQSTNGTYVLMQDQPKPILIHQDTLSLMDRGSISLGRATEQDDPDIIRFECFVKL